MDTTPDTSKVPVGHIKGIARSFGFEPNTVASILIEPSAVVVTCFTLPKTGATVVHRIPVTPN